MLQGIDGELSKRRASRAVHAVVVVLSTSRSATQRGCTTQYCPTLQAGQGDHLKAALQLGRIRGLGLQDVCRPDSKRIQLRRSAAARRFLAQGIWHLRICMGGRHASPNLKSRSDASETVMRTRFPSSTLLSVAIAIKSVTRGEGRLVVCDRHDANFLLGVRRKVQMDGRVHVKGHLQANETMQSQVAFSGLAADWGTIDLPCHGSAGGRESLKGARVYQHVRVVWRRSSTSGSRDLAQIPRSLCV